jgi:branched-chain amino acid transport system permease protein
MKWQQALFLAGLAVAVYVLKGMPARVDRYEVFLLYTLFLNIALSQSWNLVGGYTGLISLGHAGFFGIGAYTAAICMRKFDWSFEPSIAAGAGLAMLFALVVSFPTFRFRGVYFAIGTLTLGEALRIWMINWDWIGGAQGIRFPIRELPSLEDFYYIMLGVAAAITLLVYLISQSQLGLGLRAIRDNEASAQNMGVNIFRTKLVAFLISAAATGLVGAIHGARLTTIEPYSIFGVSWTISMVNMTIIGGMGTVLGPIAGAAFVTFLDDELADYYKYHLIITGIIFIFVIRFMPQGIWGWIQSVGLPWLLRQVRRRVIISPAPEESHAA